MRRKKESYYDLLSSRRRGLGNATYLVKQLVKLAASFVIKQSLRFLAATYHNSYY